MNTNSSAAEWSTNLFFVISFAVAVLTGLTY
jgi:hypothetical protein